ncbi:MAG: acid phosphatase, partial [Gemmatimonadaceae bacterium]
MLRTTGFVAIAAAAVTIAACASASRNPNAGPSVDPTTQLRNDIKNVVVIYAENRSFDNLFGRFPHANGIDAVLANGRPSAAYVKQKDRDGVSVLPVLPPTWGNVTQRGITPVVTEAQSAGLPNQPFAVETAFKTAAGATLTTSTVTRDLAHRFFENQMQINGGKNDMFAAWTDAGGLTMGHYDYSQSAIFKLAQEFVLADNFFQGAFGGSFLNHQYLICACAPEYPDAATTPDKPSITALETSPDGTYLPVLKMASTSPPSALDGPPVFALSGNITPANYFGDGKFYAINTMQPPYQPSLNRPSGASDNELLFANARTSTTLPPQTQRTIGDALTAKNVEWTWYSGSWNAAVADGRQAPDLARSVIYIGNANGIATPDSVAFQAHHQPFNYYAAFDPMAHAADRARHLKDYNDLIDDAAKGTLPPVAFYKPEGVFNQHEGYTAIAGGDAKIASVVAALRKSSQWKNMLVIITYDEFGGVWDHASPPKADRLGPGTRIPAIIISPFAKKGTVDHTQYDTGSILRLITRLFDLDRLPGLAARDSALLQVRGRPMGDLTNA